MFEDKSELLQGHIDFFKAVLSEEEGGDYDEFEVAQRIKDCTRDIEEVRSDLPYDELNEEDEPIEDFSGENLEDGELEDEVVEIEGLINELKDLMDEVRGRLDDEGDEDVHRDIIDQTGSCDSQDFTTKLEVWLAEEITAKCKRQGLNLSTEAIARKMKAIVLGARCCGRYEEAESLAQEKYPEYGFTSEDLKQEGLFSPGLFHIAMEMIQTHSLLKERFNFTQWLKAKREFWENVI